MHISKLSLLFVPILHANRVMETLRAVLCKNQTKLEMKNFEPPTQIYMEVGPHEGCSKMSIIEVITHNI